MSGTISSSKRTWLESRRDAKMASILVLEETYESLSARLVEESRVNTGEGSHMTRLRKLDDIEKQIDRLERQIDALNRKISGWGDIINMNVRRKW